MTRVRLEQISKHFGDVAAVDSIDLTIEPGELFFLLGPSGCGKSTLLRLIAGLHEPSAGAIYFNDRNVTNLPTEKRNAAMCFQSYALWPHMSVLENIRFGLDVRKTPAAEAAARVDEVLKLVQLDHLAARKPNELSGGQQQRVALARALVVKPDCLLLDEPLSNLDAKLRLEMRSEIRRICRSAGLTAVYVTHDQKEALSIADRMAVLNKGKIEQLGSPRELYLRPQNRFVAQFMGETNLLEGEVIRAESNQTVVRCALGDVHANTNGIAAGKKVAISLRPEAVKVGAAPANAVNTFAGEIHDTIYLGEVGQHVVSVGKAAELRVFELNPRVVARDGAREATSVWFDPADVVVLSN